MDLVGTTPNIVLKGYYEQNIPEAKLDFLKYMLYALPVSIILEFLAWAWLAFLWLPKGYYNLLTSKFYQHVLINLLFLYQLLYIS